MLSALLYGVVLLAGQQAVPCVSARALGAEADDSLTGMTAARHLVQSNDGVPDMRGRGWNWRRRKRFCKNQPDECMKTEWCQQNAEKCEKWMNKGLKKQKGKDMNNGKDKMEMDVPEIRGKGWGWRRRMRFCRNEPEVCEQTVWCERNPKRCEKWMNKGPTKKYKRMDRSQEPMPKEQDMSGDKQRKEEPMEEMPEESGMTPMELEQAVDPMTEPSAEPDPEATEDGDPGMPKDGGMPYKQQKGKTPENGGDGMPMEDEEGPIPADEEEPVPENGGDGMPMEDEEGPIPQDEEEPVPENGGDTMPGGESMPEDGPGCSGNGFCKEGDKWRVCVDGDSQVWGTFDGDGCDKWDCSGVKVTKDGECSFASYSGGFDGFFVPIPGDSHEKKMDQALVDMLKDDKATIGSNSGDNSRIEEFLKVLKKRTEEQDGGHVNLDFDEQGKKEAETVRPRNIANMGKACTSMIVVEQC